MEVHEFKESLRYGQTAEEFISCFYDGMVQRLSGFKADFIFIAPDDYVGKGLEVKTDGYRSPNVFVERWSKSHVTDDDYGGFVALENPKPGGMWQAHGNGVEYFAYFLPMYGKIIFFDTDKLIVDVDNLVQKRNIELCPVINKSREGHYQSMGYRIPRMVLEKHALFIRDLREAEKGGLKTTITETEAVYVLDGKTYRFPLRGKPIFDMAWKPYPQKGK